MGTRRPAHAYQCIDAAMVRAAVHDRDVLPASWPLLGEETEPEGARAWLVDVWSDARVAEAVRVASPVLADQVQKVCAGQRPGDGQVQRMVLAVARYLVRMRTRATPFGIFAGVAPLRLAPADASRWGSDMVTRVRPDMRWLASMIRQLEACESVRGQLRVRTNDLVQVRGERLVVPWQPHATDTNSGGREVSVRYTPAMQMIVQLARSPIQVADLCQKLAAEFSDVTPSVIEGVIAELITQGVLITNLRPGSTRTDPLDHILTQLHQVKSETWADVAPLVARLGAIHTRLTSTRPSGIRSAASPQVVAESMRALSPVADQPLMIDLALSPAAAVPRQVAAEVERAAQTMMRLAPHASGREGWRHYHDAFLARYGAGALVPVRDLVDSTAGLGYPAHFREAPGSEPPRPMSRRDELLLALAQRAALDGAHEIILDDGLIDGLIGHGQDDLAPAPHLEICAEVHAPTRSALTSGNFSVAVRGVGRSAAALTGRFFDLMPEAVQSRMLSEYAGLPTMVAGAVPAQLSFPPRHPRVDNVARTLRILPDLIELAEHRTGNSCGIALEDLAVTADTDRFYLVSLSRRQVIEPIVANATARYTWPPMARLLFELPRARTASVAPFAWGAAQCLPFLPRIRYRRTVLSPARWRIPPSQASGLHTCTRGQTATVDQLRDRLRLPVRVAVGEFDRRLVLRLDQPMDLALFRAHLDKASRTGEVAVVDEAPAPEDFGWCDGRTHEIVIPLASTTPPAPAPAALTRSGRLPLIGRDHGVLPGGRVLYAKLYGDPASVDAIATRHLPDLLARWPRPPQWWFVRHRDPTPHLRLRLHLDDEGEGYGVASVRVGQWTADLRHLGLVADLTFETYHPENARYGHGAAMSAAEAVFAADSAATQAQLRVHPRQIDPVALTAASMIDLAGALAGSRPAAMHWLVGHADRADSTALDRDLVRQTIALCEDLASVGSPIEAAWRSRRDAATGYVEQLAGETCRVPDSVIASLLHMHHNRALGVNPETEHLCHRLARATALSWAARHQTSRGDQT